MAKAYIFRELCKTIGHHLVVFLLVTSCLLALLFAIFFSLIINQPRSFPFLTNYINSSLQEEFSDINLHLEEVFFVWDEQRYNIDIRASNLIFENDEGKLIANFPNLDINFSLLALLHGKFLPKEVVLSGPTFRVYLDSAKQKDEEEIIDHIKKGESRLAMDAVVRYFSEFSHARKTFPLEKIIIKKADIYIDRGDEEFIWCVENLESTISSNDLELTVRNTFKLDLAGEPLGFDLNFVFPTYGAPVAELYFDDTPSYALIHCIPKDALQPWMLTHNSQFSASGKAIGEFNEAGVLQTVELEVKDGRGHIFDKNYLKYPLRFDDMRIKGSISNGFTLTHLEQATVVFSDGLTFESSGFLKSQGKEMEADLNLAVRGFKLEFFDTYWPVNAAPKVRDWIADHVPTGRVKEAYASLQLRPEYFKEGGAIPPSAINATVYFDRLSIEYLKDFPKAHSLGGVLRIRKNELDIKLEDGQIGYSTLQDTDVTITNILSQDRRLNIKGYLHGPALDVFHFIPKDSVQEDWFNYTQTTGSATTKVDISIPLIQGLRYKDMYFDIESDLSDVSMPVLYNFIPLQQGEFHAKFKGTTLEVSGKAKLAESPSSLHFKAGIEPGKFTYDMTAQTEILPGTFESIGIQDVVSIESGSVKVRVDAKKNPANTALSVNMDFAPSKLLSQTLNFEKPLGEKMRAKLLSTFSPNGDIAIKPLSLEGAQVGGTLSAHFEKGFSILKNLKATNFVFGKYNAFEIDYDLKDDYGFVLDVRGQKMDLRPINLQHFVGEGKDAKTKYLKDMKLHLDRVYMKENVQFSKLYGTMQCTKNTCTSASIKANVGGEDEFEATIAPLSDRKRSLVVMTGNAGNVLRGVGLYSKIGGGKLYLDSEIILEQNREGEVFNRLRGTVEMKEFSALKTPAVANLITISSLPGLLGLLEKDTIPFDIMKGRFQFFKKELQLDDFQITGPAMGVTGEGTVDLDANVIDLKGTIVPAVLGINRLLGKVPVLGDIVGGDAEGGIIGVNYRVTGPADDPKATVNALSALAPGFLRKLFQ